MSKVLLGSLTLAMLFGCTHSIEGPRYLKNEPNFKPENFFEGHVKAWGIVQNRSGNMVQQFAVAIDGTIDRTVANGVLTLDETFCYLVGTGVTQRVWKIELNLPNSNYRGKASDIDGVAVGSVYGNAMNWKYDMELPVDGSSYHVSFDDWMWAFDSQRLVNRSYIKKWGFVVAEVTIFMEKISAGDASNSTAKKVQSKNVQSKKVQSTFDCLATSDQEST